MKFVITGCYGFIGQKMCEYLLKNNHIVLGLDIKNKYTFNEYNNFKYLKPKYKSSGMCQLGKKCHNSQKRFCSSSKNQH